MTAAERRLSKLEGALRPREAVLAWLAEAQQFTTITDYGRRVAELPIEAAPLSVIGRRVDAAVRQDMKGQPRQSVEDAVYRSTGDAIYLYALVFQINIDAVETAKVEGLRAAAVFYWMGCLLGGPRDDELAPDEVADHHRELAQCWATWRSVVDRLDLDVRVANEARTTLAGRYYGGHDVLLADAAMEWARHVDVVERLKAFADDIRPPDPGRAARPRRRREHSVASVKERAESRVSWLTDLARVRAYDVLGDHPKAVAIMERRILSNEMAGAPSR
jgi:hypothetical protein